MSYEEHFLIALVPGILDDPTIPDKITTSEKWTRNVRNDVCRIGTSRVGNTLLRAIRFHGRIVIITPYKPLRSTVHCQAATIPPQTKAVQIIGASIEYTPEFYGRGTACEASPVSNGSYRPPRHEVLFHELVHAFRFLSLGIHVDSYEYVSLDKGLVFYNELEEFYAVLIQGIYASEWKRPIRASHLGHMPIDKKLEGSYLFFQGGTQTYDAVAIFCDQNRGFTKAISKIDTNFNPIRAYYENPDKAKEYANSELAKARDDVMPMAKSLRDFLKKIL